MKNTFSSHKQTRKMRPKKRPWKKTIWKECDGIPIKRGTILEEKMKTSISKFTKIDGD